MANRFRKFIESIIFVGMTPGAQKTADSSPRKLRLFASLERFLSAPSPSDPFYLTNRTFGQKLTRVLWFALPVAAVVGLAMVAIVVHASKSAKPAREPAAAEKEARILPNLNTDFGVESNKELEVLDVHCEHTGGSLLVGDLQNKTDHPILAGVVIFDLADGSGSRLGAVAVTERDIAPGAVRQFRQPIEQTTATGVLVRDVQTR